MKRSMSFVTLHRIFAAAAAMFIVGFFAFLAYLYVAFSGILTGDVKTEVTPDLLSNLQVQRFEASIGRMERRMNLPEIPADLPDPFDAPARPSAP